jgi:hypothetical protein
VSDFSGPDDLAALLTSYHSRLRGIEAEGGGATVGLCNVSDSALKALFGVAYRASFLKEEGRAVTACLYAPPQEDPEDDGGASLTGPISTVIARLARLQRKSMTNYFALAEPFRLDDPKHIARFAPTLGAEDAVLVVGETDGAVECRGISLLDYEDAENHLLRMPRGWKGSGGLYVHILGPGELLVSEGHCEFALRANQIKVTREAVYTFPVSQWLHDLASDYVQQCSDYEDWKHGDLGKPDLAVVDLVILWSRVLREAVLMGHGGAFVILSDGQHDAHIGAKYPLNEFDLGEALRRTWRALCTVKQTVKSKDDPLLVDHLEHKRQMVHKLCSASRSIGQMSATDGCVILDRQLKLRGFGGEIRVTDAPDKKCYRVVGDNRTELSADDLLLPFGQRHKSAFRLCAAIPYCMVFVISQDGDLRLFHSTDDEVHLYDSLHA